MISPQFKIYWRGKWRNAKYSTEKDLVRISAQHFLATLVIAFATLSPVLSVVVSDKVLDNLSAKTKLIIISASLGWVLTLAFAHLIYFLIKNERHQKW